MNGNKKEHLISNYKHVGLCLISILNDLMYDVELIIMFMMDKHVVAI